MLTFGGGRMFLVAGATDMRKSFHGLSGIVRETLPADPRSRHLFCFCNRLRNRLKVLVADASGMWVLSKRLDRGTFAWPAADGAAMRVGYCAEQSRSCCRASMRSSCALGHGGGDFFGVREWSRRSLRCLRHDCGTPQRRDPSAAPATR